jgi:predicted YcjX-like family ATPase
LVLTTLTDGLGRGLDTITGAVSETFFEPVVRLGVTGLARSGKTVFITALVANLLDRGRMGGMAGVAKGAITAAYLRPQPDDTVARFPYEANLAQLTGTTPAWPAPTAAISELRLSFRVRPQGLLGAVAGPRTVHLDIVDYPGEWLLDLALMNRSYAEWSEATLARLPQRPGGAEALAALTAADPAAAFDEVAAQSLAAAFTTALHAAADAGYADCTPGRFLLPGDLKGSPVLTFAPLPPQSGAKRGSLWREFERRFDAYRAQVARPFFRDHFARIDRQVVLVDALGALHAGPRAVEDLRRTMTDILTAFRPGANGWFAGLTGRRVERILFAATKADHIHHSQHARLTAIMEALVADARRRADFAGAKTAAMAIASLRATVEEERTHGGRTLQMVRGRLLGTGKEAAFHPGDLPEDPAAILAPAREGAAGWLTGDWPGTSFAPAALRLAPGDGPPHIRLDRAAEFLFGDRLT